MKVTPIKTRIFKERESLHDFIISHVKKIKENSILVITSKIVSLSEGRCLVAKNEKEIEAIIQKESQYAIKTRHVWLTIKDGIVQASAGVDKSNGDGKIILAPEDSFKTASALRKKLSKYYKIKNLGILITDSQLVPLRAGVIGLALGYAGFKGVKDYRGKPDLFGRTLQFSSTNMADGFATSATLEMGEGGESQPLALITDSNVVFAEHIDTSELKINPQEDIYWPLFKKAKK